MARHRLILLEGILALIKTGTASYPSEARSIEAILTEMATALPADASGPGIVELATDTEAIGKSLTTRALTPANLAAVMPKLWLSAFDGKNGAGACTLTGAAVGDLVLSVVCYTDANQGNAEASFESVITVVDQIQQTAVGDLSTLDYVALLYHPA